MRFLVTLLFLFFATTATAQTGDHPSGALPISYGKGPGFFAFSIGAAKPLGPENFGYSHLRENEPFDDWTQVVGMALEARIGTPLRPGVLLFGGLAFSRYGTHFIAPYTERPDWSFEGGEKMVFNLAAGLQVEPFRDGAVRPYARLSGGMVAAGRSDMDWREEGIMHAANVPGRWHFGPSVDVGVGARMPVGRTLSLFAEGGYTHGFVEGGVSYAPVRFGLAIGDLD